MLSYPKRFYYLLKPVIPRRLQVFLRQRIVSAKRSSHENIWPIDERAGKKPEGWLGWPGEKQFAFVLMHDVDTEAGHDRCPQLMRLDEKMGFRSSFNFVPERYPVSPELRQEAIKRGFEVGVHGLKHDGKLFLSRKRFRQQAVRINRYLKEWKSVGFVSPSMHRNLDWMHELNIEYDASTFDTDPFEPQSDGIGTIFPFRVRGNDDQKEYIELPYTLPQDFTLLVLMREQTVDIWKRKLDWIAEKGGMALLIAHPDYMNFENDPPKTDEYPVDRYRELLDYVREKYADRYWNPLPKEMARFWKERPTGKEVGEEIREFEITQC